MKGCLTQDKGCDEETCIVLNLTQGSPRSDLDGTSCLHGFVLISCLDKEV